MIVPFLRGFLSWNKAPLTWMIVFLNVVIFVMTYQSNDIGKVKYYQNPENLILTGKLYYQYQNPSSEMIPDISAEKWVLLGSQGARDIHFLRASKEHTFFGDPVAIKHWKQDVDQLIKIVTDRNVKTFGLSSDSQQYLSWITYQFMHSGAMHLLSNMVMLIIFGSALEIQIGSLIFAIIYLLGGIAAGLGFFVMSGSSFSPLVGASGSLSAIMAFYVFYETKKRIPFFYFFSPFGKFWGFVYLPTLMVLPISFLPDVVGYLVTPNELGAGIAYAAHLGGALFGGFMGIQARMLMNLLISRGKASAQ